MDSSRSGVGERIIVEYLNDNEATERMTDQLPGHQHKLFPAVSL
jgi:hypothetical protein